MGARAEALATLRSDFVSGRGLLHELAQAAGFRMADIAGEVSRDDWYARRARVQRGLPADPLVSSDESRCRDILSSLEEVARAWSDKALQAPEGVKPLELRAMIHAVRDLLETTQQARGMAAEPPPPRRFSIGTAPNGQLNANGHPLDRLREDNDSRYAS